jgi:CrcB protein
MNMILSIAAGGALGAVFRHLANMAALALTGPAFPWGTLFVNIAGSFLMGLLAGMFGTIWTPPAELRAFLTVGFLGALTTFSTYSLDVVTLWERGETLAAVSYGTGSAVLSIAALIGGLFLARAVLA